MRFRIQREGLCMRVACARHIRNAKKRPTRRAGPVVDECGSGSSLEPSHRHGYFMASRKTLDRFSSSLGD